MTVIGDFNSFRDLNLVRDVFIETGTFIAQTTKAAATAGFECVHSIEVVEKYWKNAQIILEDYPHVHLHHGSSPSVLPHIIDPTQSTTFWLDAHFQGQSTEEMDPETGQCPLLRELEIIFSYNWGVTPLILIDDAHMFCWALPEGFKEGDWPTFDKIVSIIPDGYRIQDRDNILVIANPDLLVHWVEPCRVTRNVFLRL